MFISPLKENFSNQLFGKDEIKLSSNIERIEQSYNQDTVHKLVHEMTLCQRSLHTEKPQSQIIIETSEIYFRISTFFYFFFISYSRDYIVISVFQLLLIGKELFNLNKTSL